MASSTIKIEYQGVAWTITATEANGGVSFNITSDTLEAGDIRGFFLDLETDTGSKLESDSISGDGFNWFGGKAITGNDITQTQWGENLVIDLGNGANINGAPSNVPPEGYEGPDNFDLGIEFGTAGASNDFINSTSFTVKGMTLADLKNQFFALRLTSTGADGEGSLKLVGQFPPLGGNDPAYQGFSRGSWLNGFLSADLARSNDPTGLFEGSTPSYESLFLGDNSALTFTSAGKGNPTLDEPTLAEALGLNGGDLNQFAAQSAAAYLNALYLENDGDLLTAYSLTKEVVQSLTAEVLNSLNDGTDGTVDLSGYQWFEETNGVSGFQQGDIFIQGSTGMGMKELTGLFDFYNNFGSDPSEFMLNPSPQPLLV